MKKLALFLFGLFACLGLAQAASPTAYVTATISITNAAGTATNETLTVNGDVRTLTDTVVVAASQILTNGTPASAAVNLLNQVALFPFSHLSLMQTAPTNIFLQSQTNMDLIVTLSPGWGTVTLATNNLSSATVVRMPLTLETLAVQTNVASAIAAAINSNANTNPIVAPFVSGTLTNQVPSTNVTLSTVSSLTSSGSVTNYALPLLPGSDGNLVQIYTANTNVFFTLSNTNKSDWRRSVLIRGWTNTLNVTVLFASPVVVAGSTLVVTAGKSKLLTIYNPDTTGTNVLVDVQEAPGPADAVGVLHNNGTGLRSYSLVVDADISGTLSKNTTGTSGGLIAGSTIAASDGSSLTNLTLQYPTNNSGTTTLSWRQAYRTNLAANVTIALATPGAAFYESIVYWTTNSSASDRSVTSPSGCIGPVGSGTPSVLWSTNKTITRYIYEHYGPSDITVGKTDFGP